MDAYLFSRWRTKTFRGMVYFMIPIGYNGQLENDTQSNNNMFMQLKLI